MGEKHSIKFNFIMNSILTLSSFIFPLITFPYVSRVLLPTGTGKVTFATSVISYFSLIAQLGIPTYGIRACSQVREDREALSKTVKELLVINSIMSVVAYALLFLAIAFVPRFSGDKILYLIASLAILFNDIGMEWLYQAVEKYSYITIRTIVFKLIALAAMFLLVKDEGDYVIYCAISVFASSASKLLNFVQAGRIISLKQKGLKLELKKHMKPIIVFFAMSCAVTIYTNLDVVMLGFMKTDTDVGYYNAAVKIKTILVSIVTSLGAVLLPRASNYVKNNLTDELEKIEQKALTFVFLFATPLAIYFVMFASYGIGFLSGDAYEASVLPMQILMPTLLLIGITNIFGYQFLIPAGKERVVMYSEIVGATVDVVINLILIPRFASTGAAIGTLMAEISVFIYQFGYVKDTARPMLRKIPILKILCSVGVGCLLSIWIIVMDSLSDFWTLAISAVLFFGGYVVTLVIMREDFLLYYLEQARNTVKGRLFGRKL